MKNRSLIRKLPDGISELDPITKASQVEDEEKETIRRSNRERRQPDRFGQQSLVEARIAEKSTRMKALV